MKIARSIIVFLIASVLLSCSVFAVDDLFNTTGEVTEDPVYAGIHFVLPDYYTLSNEGKYGNKYSADSDKVILGFTSCSEEEFKDEGYSLDEEGVKKFFNSTLNSAAGLFGSVKKQSYSNAVLAGIDSITGYGETSSNKYYMTFTDNPNTHAVVITIFRVPIKKDDTYAQYETDYANMLKNAYIDENAQPVTEQPTKEQPAEEQPEATQEKKGGTDWEKYGDAWSDLGDAFESLENEDIGGAFDALGDAYQKLGEFAEGN